MFEIYVQIFGFKLVPIETSGDRSVLDQKLIWHEDVQMHSAWIVDDSGDPEFLGYAYLDLFPRDGKFTHTGQYALQRVSIRHSAESCPLNADGRQTEISSPGRELVPPLFVPRDESPKTDNGQADLARSELYTKPLPRTRTYIPLSVKPHSIFQASCG